jgi:hypothetical protein
MTTASAPAPMLPDLSGTSKSGRNCVMAARGVDQPARPPAATRARAASTEDRPVSGIETSPVMTLDDAPSHAQHQEAPQPVSPAKQEPATDVKEAPCDAANEPEATPTGSNSNADAPRRETLFLQLYHEALAKPPTATPCAHSGSASVQNWAEWCDRVSASMEDASAKAVALELKGQAPPPASYTMSSGPAVKQYGRLKQVDAAEMSAAEARVPMAPASAASTPPMHPSSAAQQGGPPVYQSPAYHPPSHASLPKAVRAPAGKASGVTGAASAQRANDKAPVSRSRGTTQSVSPVKQVSRYSTPEWDGAGALLSCTICGKPCVDGGEFCGRCATKSSCNCAAGHVSPQVVRISRETAHLQVVVQQAVRLHYVNIVVNT